MSATVVVVAVKASRAMSGGTVKPLPPAYLHSVLRRRGLHERKHTPQRHLDGDRKVPSPSPPSSSPSSSSRPCRGGCVRSGQEGGQMTSSRCALGLLGLGELGFVMLNQPLQPPLRRCLKIVANATGEEGSGRGGRGRWWIRIAASGTAPTELGSVPSRVLFVSRSAWHHQLARRRRVTSSRATGRSERRMYAICSRSCTSSRDSSPRPLLTVAFYDVIYI